MATFNNVESFRFWCQKVLPLVFDDSLSYYEVLCKIAQKLNIVIENNNNLPEFIEEKIVEYITSDKFEEILKHIQAAYVEDEERIYFSGYPVTPDVTCDTHVYSEPTETIKIVGR